jgi:hypothetical protein
MVVTRLGCPSCLQLLQLLRLRSCQRGGLLSSKFGLTGLLHSNINPDPRLLDDLRMHSHRAKMNFCFRLSGHDKPVRFRSQVVIFISGLL